MQITIKRVHAPSGDDPYLQAEPAEQESPAPSPMNVPDNATIAYAAEAAGIERADIGMVLLNGATASLETRLKDGDAVTIVGHVTGM